MFLDDPGIPQNVVHDLRRDKQGGCFLLLFWSSPTGLHFMINISGINYLSVNETTNFTMVSLCSCDPINVTIVGFNTCGEMGASTYNITIALDQKSQSLHQQMCPDAITSDSITDDILNVTVTQGIQSSTDSTDAQTRPNQELSSGKFFLNVHVVLYQLQFLIQAQV